MILCLDLRFWFYCLGLGLGCYNCYRSFIELLGLGFDELL